MRRFELKTIENSESPDCDLRARQVEQIGAITHQAALTPTTYVQGLVASLRLAVMSS